MGCILYTIGFNDATDLTYRWASTLSKSKVAWLVLSALHLLCYRLHSMELEESIKEDLYSHKNKSSEILFKWKKKSLKIIYIFLDTKPCGI